MIPSPTAMLANYQCFHGRLFQTSGLSVRVLRPSD